MRKFSGSNPLCPTKQNDEIETWNMVRPLIIRGSTRYSLTCVWVLNPASVYYFEVIRTQW